MPKEYVVHESLGMRRSRRKQKKKKQHNSVRGVLVKRAILSPQYEGPR
jgi:hypothetical protein